MASPSKQPDPELLHEAALAHLARYPATRAGLLRVLVRRIARWARTAEGEPEAIDRAVSAAEGAARQVVEQLAENGIVDDAAFAAARARRLARSGSSRRHIAAHLARHGVAERDLTAALPDDPLAELTAALRFARKRHIGPFRAGAPPDRDARRRELAAMARAGYSAAIADAALAMPPQDAVARLLAARERGD
ncbi:MAG: RecX family transcriptional regulator [Acetobacteraceae bacterium]